MPATRHGFGAHVEGLLYLDSSFVIATLNESESHHAACIDFHRRLDSATVLPVVSDLVYEEVAFHRLRTVLSDAARARGIPWRRVLKQDPTVFDAAMTEVASDRADIEALALGLPLIESVRPRAFDLMRSFRLLPADAFHIAVALEHEVDSFVTLDRDFLDVDGIRVYTCV